MTESVFKYQHRVIYAECTIGNHVYYSRYLDILEAARGEFFRHLGFPLLELQAAGVVFPVIGLQITYKGPARYDDILTVELWLTELKGIRLSFGARIVNGGGVTLLDGETRHVCANTEERPTRPSKEILERLQPFLHLKNDAT